MELGLVQMQPDETDWPLLDVLALIILLPTLVVLFLFFVWKVRVRQQRLADLAPLEVVNSLPVKLFVKSKMQVNDPMECVICLEEYQDRDELRILPCRHEYHSACIDNWLTTRKRFCPICKRDICTSSLETTPLLIISGLQPEYDSESTFPSSSSSGSLSTSSASSFSGTPETSTTSQPSEEQVLQRV